jgi:hypothetical protein
MLTRVRCSLAGQPGLTDPGLSGYQHHAAAARQRIRQGRAKTASLQVPRDQSGTRKGRATAKKGNRYLAGVLGETAASAGRTQTREGARYRRLARRRGKLKAQVAVGTPS